MMISLYPSLFISIITGLVKRGPPSGPCSKKTLNLRQGSGAFCPKINDTNKQTKSIYRNNDFMISSITNINSADIKEKITIISKRLDMDIHLIK
jgi:hypothetical protein